MYFWLFVIVYLIIGLGITQWQGVKYRVPLNWKHYVSGAFAWPFFLIPEDWL